MYWYLILFLIVMFLFSQKEGFRPKRQGEHPMPPTAPRGTHDVYGPGDGGMAPSGRSGGGGGDNKNLHGSNLMDPRFQRRNSKTTPSDMGPDSDYSGPQPPPDDGSNSSDTTTQQNAIYFYKPFAMLPFPKADGPPVPYLDDFKVFQK